MNIKSKKKCGKHDGVNKIVADLCGVSTNYVSMVRNGHRTGPRSERILRALMEILEGEKSLIAEVKKVVDLEAPAPKRQPFKYGDLQ